MVAQRRGNADRGGARGETSQDNVRVTVAVHVARIHGHPSSGIRFGQRAWLKLKPAPVLEVNESFNGLFLEIGKKRDGRDVEIAIPVEICRVRTIRAFHWIKP